MRRKFFFFISIFLLPNLKASDQGAIFFSDLLKSNPILGISSESFDSLEILKRQSHWYALWKKKLLNTHLKNHIELACDQDFSFKRLFSYRNHCINNVLDEVEKKSLINNNPFCLWINDFKKTNISIIKKKRIDYKVKNLIQKVLKSHLSQVNIKEIGSDLDFSFSNWNFIFKKKSYKDYIKNLIDLVLSESSVQWTNAFLLALGLRVEDEFPDRLLKEKVIHIYEKSLNSSWDAFKMQSIYRLSLLEITEKKYERAFHLLNEIRDENLDKGYRLRIGYWKYYCAKQLQNSIQAQKMKQWLLREYPMSLHYLIAHSFNFLENETEHLVYPEVPFWLHPDPEIHLRSKENFFENQKLRAIEILIYQNQFHLAKELLLKEKPKLGLAENEPLLLYWASLLDRVGDRKNAFELMAQLFHQNPYLISRSSLSLMYPLHYWDIILKQNNKVDPYLLISIIRQESAFQLNARSSVGALGLMQLRKSTANMIDPQGLFNLKNPNHNISLGSKYLKRLIDNYKGDIPIALAAYNAGPSYIKKWLNRYPFNNRLLFLDLIPIKETREYVASVIRNYYWYSKIYKNSIDQKENYFIFQNFLSNYYISSLKIGNK